MGWQHAEADDPLLMHKMCSICPAFQFEVHQVIDVQDAVRVEMEAIKWRDELPSRGGAFASCPSFRTWDSASSDQPS